MSSFSLTGGMFSTDAMQQVFSDAVRIQRMLDFEAALARAEARAGVIPEAAVGPIVACCRAGMIDLPALAQAAGHAGNLAIPLVKQLTVQVEKRDREASKYVHWGATSQDAIDTGMVLQLRDALGLIEQDLARLADALARLAEQHRDAPMTGRTWMQHALPLTFGLKAAGWLDAVLRHGERLRAMQEQIAVLQFGGAAGTLASLGCKGMQVAEALAQELGLALPDVPWHAQRDRMAEVAAVLGMLTGTLGKIARDIALQMQTEVAEVAEPTAAGRGGSSTMPHKRNPVGCAATLAIAVRMPGLVSTMLGAMVQEQERALGGWQAEWDTLPEIVQLTAGALRQMTYVASGLTVDAARMQANLQLTRGLIMAEAVTLALGAKLGRMRAHELVEQAARAAAGSRRQLRDVLAAEKQVTDHLSAQELDRLLDPAGYTGEAGAMVDRVLQRYRQHRNERGNNREQSKE